MNVSLIIGGIACVTVGIAGLEESPVLSRISIVLGITCLVVVAKEVFGV